MESLSLLEALKMYVERLKEPRRPLGPFLAPRWLETWCEAEGVDLDECARSYGFDGYEVFGEPPCSTTS
jgi:hypothetical protein